MSVTILQSQHRTEIARYWQWHKSGRSGPFKSPLGRQISMHVTTDCSASISCRDICTYDHTRRMHQQIDVGLGLKIIDQAWSSGFNEILFTGGGEPLEPQSRASFFTLLQAAKLAGFKTALITNGLFLSSLFFHELFPFLDSLRISIHGHTHLQELSRIIAESRDYCLKFKRGDTQIGISMLVTPEENNELLFRAFHSLAIVNDLDFIYIKLAHLRKQREGSFTSNILSFREIIKFTEGLKRDLSRLRALNVEELSYPDIWISARDPILRYYNAQYPFCYYSDFQFIAQADGRVAFCCEHGYDPEYEKGDINKQSVEEILNNRQPQQIGEKCFRGCAGDLFNSDAHKLINE